MSGIGGGGSTPTSGAPTAIGPHVEHLLALAAFVQTPEYADRVRELAHTEMAANDAVAAAEVRIAEVNAIAADTADAKAAHEREKAAFDESHRQRTAQLERRELAAQQAADDLKRQQADAAKVWAAKAKELDERDAAVAAREAGLTSREADLQIRLTALAADQDTLRRRLAKLAEAAQA